MLSLSMPMLAGYTLPSPMVAPRVGSFARFGRLAMQTQDELKQMVGAKAIDDYVTSGMVVGLGTGSTAAFAVSRLGEKLKSGELKDIIAVPTSVRTFEQATELGIPLTTLDTHSKVSWTHHPHPPPPPHPTTAVNPAGTPSTRSTSAPTRSTRR